MKFILLFISLLLNSCFYSEGCLRMPQSVHCFEKRVEYPVIAHYQKKSSIGNTNIKQRWVDVVACGAIDSDETLRSAVTKGPRESVDNILADKFENCMSNRRYMDSRLRLEKFFN